MKQVADYQVSLKAILKNSLWETLILKTPENSGFLGKYDFPGGRIDEDEFHVDYLDILRREIKEEVGDVKVELENKVVAIGRHQHKWKYIIYIVYEGKILDENIHISFEHSWFEFVKLEEIDIQSYFMSGMLEVVKMYLHK